jgi:hypothetical protein
MNRRGAETQRLSFIKVKQCAWTNQRAHMKKPLVKSSMVETPTLRLGIKDGLALALVFSASQRLGGLNEFGLNKQI